MVSVFMSGERWSQSLGGAGGLPVGEAGGRQVPGQRSLCPKQAEDRRAAWLGRRVRLPSVSTGLVRVALGDESTTQALRAQLRRASHPKPHPVFSGDPADPMARSFQL